MDMACIFVSEKVSRDGKKVKENLYSQHTGDSLEIEQTFHFKQNGFLVSFWSYAENCSKTRQLININHAQTCKGNKRPVHGIAVHDGLECHRYTYNMIRLILVIKLFKMFVLNFFSYKLYSLK